MHTFYNNTIRSWLDKNKDNILLVVGFGSLILPILENSDILPTPFFAVLDLILLGYGFFSLNIPKKITGINISSYCSLIFAITAIFGYLAVQHKMELYSTALIFSSNYILVQYLFVHFIRWDNLQGKIKTTYETSYEEYRKKDSCFNRKNTHLLWGLITRPELEFLNFHIVLKLIFPIYVGVFF